MILVVGGIKGGSGKTTLATNLTTIRAADEKKVLLVDADDQRSATDWVEQREALYPECTKFVTISLTGKSIYSQLPKMTNDYDDIIVDTGGRDTTSQRAALAIADYFLVPFKPRSIDIWTIGSVKRMIAEILSINENLKCSFVINQADSNGTDNQSSLNVLSECTEAVCVPLFIGNRKSFCNAAADGLSVVETKVKDRKAIGEILHLYNFIYG